MLRQLGASKRFSIRGIRYFSHSFNLKTDHVLKLVLPGTNPFPKGSDCEDEVLPNTEAESERPNPPPSTSHQETAGPLDELLDAASYDRMARIQNLLNSSGKLPLNYNHYLNRRPDGTIADAFYNPSFAHKPMSLLQSYRNHRITVTDLATKYCEAKFFYDMVVDPYRAPTEAMARGTVIHEILENQVNGEKIEVPKVSGRNEEWAVRFYKTMRALYQLATNGAVREMYLFGQHDDHLITGIIDLVERQSGTPFPESEKDSGNDKFVIVDTKTRASSRLPGPTELKSAYHQVLLYRKMLEDLVNGSFNFNFLYDKVNIDPDHIISDDLLEIFDVTVLPKLGTIPGIEYGINQYFTNTEFNDVCQPTMTREDLLQQYYSHFATAGKDSSQYPLRIRDLEKLITLLASCFKGLLSQNLQVQYMKMSSSKVKTVEKIQHEEEALGLDMEQAPEVKEIATFQYQYDESKVNELLDFSFQFWSNSRPPLGVEPSEVSKCKYCRWNSTCSWKSELDSLGPM